MPSNANITINRKSSNNSEAIDCIEFNREATRFDSERQYLKDKGKSCKLHFLMYDLNHPLGDLEDTQEAHTTQHRNAQWRHHSSFGQQRLRDAANYHEAVEAIEQRDEIALKA